MANTTSWAESHGADRDLDVLVVGAGFAGLYMLQRLRRLGFSVQVVEAGDDVGGTWFWNRYPGLRCDIPTTDYTYSWDPELESEWTWSEKFATQPEILRYLRYVADKHDLRKDIRFSTRVQAATWQPDTTTWMVETQCGSAISARHVVMATGALSIPKPVDIPGLATFRGDVYSTTDWPDSGVDFHGKRVAVIGTGSSGIQVIPIIAEEAAELVVFQRTPAFSLPARNGATPAYRSAMLAKDRVAYRTAAKWSSGGVPIDLPLVRAADLTADQRQLRCEWAWQTGELAAVNSVFADHITDQFANDVWADFLRAKIRHIVRDEDTAASLCPTDFPFMAKRPCFDTGYYDTFNQPHVRLVDLRKTSISGVTATGIATTEGTVEVDAVVLATGYDALTGALTAVRITGSDGRTLAQKWEDGPVTYLGLMTAGFPNLYTITGPGSPSVLSNMVVSIEQHVDWISSCLTDLRASGFHTIEATAAAETAWVRHVNDCADITLFPKANSWYLGSNVADKPRVFMPYVGGVGVYRATCEEVVAQGYLGFTRTNSDTVVCNDGVINALQPDVAAVIRQNAGHESASPEGYLGPATVWRKHSSATHPPAHAREVVTVDGSLPGSVGALPYRLYRPHAGGQYPLTVYFHGGGWVFGDYASDDDFCRALSAESGVAILSVGYSRAPFARFPTAVNDAVASVNWAAAHCAMLGTLDGELAVAGWCSGANLAAVAAQWSRDHGGPPLTGQLLIAPLTDCAPSDFARPPLPLTPGLDPLLLDWMIDHYVDSGDRHDPLASPLRATHLSGLPQAVVVTADFDPLAVEGSAYANALHAAGTPTQVVTVRGHTHTSLLNTDLLSGARHRHQIADLLRGFFDHDDQQITSTVTLSAAAEVFSVTAR